MIFMTDAAGALTYVSPEWHGLTGQNQRDAVGQGWFERLNTEDGAVLRAVIKEAAQAKAEFIVRFRLSRDGGGSIWAAAGAVPANSSASSGKAARKINGSRMALAGASSWATG